MEHDGRASHRARSEQSHGGRYDDERGGETRKDADRAALAEIAQAVEATGDERHEAGGRGERRGRDERPLRSKRFGHRVVAGGVQQEHRFVDGHPEEHGQDQGVVHMPAHREPSHREPYDPHLAGESGERDERVPGAP